MPRLQQFGRKRILAECSHHPTRISITSVAVVTTSNISEEREAEKAKASARLAEVVFVGRTRPARCTGKERIYDSEGLCL